MARRTGDIDDGDLGRQASSLFSRAVEALGEVKDVVVRTSQVGKIKLDATFVRRERDKLFQRLGEKVFDLASSGALELPGELDALRADLRALEARLEEHQREIAQVEAEAEAWREVDRNAQRAAREATEGLSGDKYAASGAPEESPGAGGSMPRKPDGTPGG